MTEASAMNLNSLPANAQSELLELLFGSTGARLSALKTTMLCNDFSTQAPWSTYDDVPGDVGMVNFTIERDLRPNGTIPFLKRAYSAGFNGTLQAYMDFPPDWMLVDSLPLLGVVEPKYYDALALYFARYVEVYRSHGLALTFLEAFNEPADSYTKMGAPQLAKFLGQHLGPLFERRGLWPSVKLSYGGQATRESAGIFQQPIVVVDAPSFHPTALFYFLAHFSRFVRPGVARLGTREAALPEGVSAVAFEAPAEEQHTPSPNGAVLQLVNRATSERQVTVCSGERIAEVMLPATSITTAMWSA